MSSNLENVKAGDNVVIKRWNYPERVASVDRVTKTLLFADGMRFRKKTGTPSRYPTWAHTTVRACTDDEEVRIEVEAHKSLLARRILTRHETELMKLPTETLEAFVKAMEENSGD